jgi:HD superfamily phosphohydrolase YqeK
MSTCKVRLFDPKGCFTVYVRGMTVVDEIFCPPLYVTDVNETKKLKEEKIRKELQETINKKLNEDIGKNIEKIWEGSETIIREGVQCLTKEK